MVRILLQKSTENKAEKMAQITEKVDVCVIGAGHAGCEAALACARMGLETVIFTVSIESIALMPCNPNIGGSSKGHLVRGHRLHIAIHVVGLKFLFSGGLRGFLGGRQAQTGDLLVGGGDQAAGLHYLGGQTR